MAKYQRLVERVISAARRQHTQVERGQPPGDYVRALERALCDENLAFVEPEPGTFVVEGSLAVRLGGSPDELRAYLASCELAAGVWLEFDRDSLGVERIVQPDDQAEGVQSAPDYAVFPEASVLVAVMTRVRDFELARDEGWYRIPVRSAPKFFPPDYVAFYFTRAFKEQAFSVRYFAPVRGHELVKRRDLLPDEADHPRAEQPYYKLQLGQLVQRKQPIVSKTWRRLTFILTNGKHFSTASEINELILGPKEHDILWRALKERGLHAERNYVIRDERAVYKVDLAVLCRDGAVGIVCGEARKRARQPQFPLLRFTPEQIETSLEPCLAAVQAAAEQLGGVK